MIKRIFTTTPDFNNPMIFSGEHEDVVFSRYAIEAFLDGDIAVGDPVFAYFDPEGSTRFEYESGWGIMGKIARIELDEAKQSKAQVLRIWYDFDDEDEPVYEYGIRYKEDVGLEQRIRPVTGDHLESLHTWADHIFDYFRRPVSGEWEQLT